MFSYRPPKGSCWGHVIRPRDPFKAKQRVNVFFDTYFEHLDPEWDTTRQFTLKLHWKTAALPNVEWPEELLKPENEQWQRVMFIVTGDRITFPLGLMFPISSSNPTSYEFLGRFSAEAPFKMSPKYFQVGIPCKNGKLAWRKPDTQIAAKLQEFIM
jgi:hypothetical protein